MAKKKDKADPELPELAAERELEEELQKKPKGMPALSLVRQEAARLGLPETDADAIFDAWLANGFRTKAGAIKDWKAAMRVWSRNNWFPSQKAEGRKRPSTQDQAIERIKRAKRGR